MNKQVINEWRTFLREDAAHSEPLSDEVIKLIFAKEIDDILKDSNLHENLTDRAKSLAKKYGLPLAVATALLTGAGTGLKAAQVKNAQAAASAAQADAPQPGDYSFHRSARPPGYAELSNRDSIEKAWGDISSLKRQRAPVSGTAPTLIGGELRNLTFTYIPTQEMLPSTILPMSLMTAQRYREMIEARVERSPRELIYLKDMIFGDTGKWASGTGNEQFRIEGNSALLPPEWSIAHEVYANVVEARLRDIEGYVKSNPDAQQEIFQKLGVQDEAQFREFLNDQLFKIGRK